MNEVKQLESPNDYANLMKMLVKSGGQETKSQPEEKKSEEDIECKETISPQQEEKTGDIINIMGRDDIRGPYGANAAMSPKLPSAETPKNKIRDRRERISSIADSTPPSDMKKRTKSYK